MKLKKLIMLLMSLVLGISCLTTVKVNAGIDWAHKAILINDNSTVYFESTDYDEDYYYFNLNKKRKVKLKFQVKSMASLEIGATVYDRNGEEIKDCTIHDLESCVYNRSTGMYETTFDIGTLNAGTFYLQVYTGYNFYNPYDINKGKVSIIANDIVVNKNTSTGNYVKTSKINKTKKFKISKKSITVKKGKKKSVTVTFKYKYGEIYSQIKNRRIVSTKWGKWKGDKCKIYIKGKKKGKTKVYITNSINKTKLVIKVKVKK